MSVIRLAILASGSGTNAAAIADYFMHNSIINVDCVVSNNENALVKDKFEAREIPFFYVSNDEWKKGEEAYLLFQERKIDWIILAGFLRKIPRLILQQYPNKIINIHPSLLPKFGGKGMYGIHVHQAVFDAGEKESGISIHLVNELYDEGKILFQKSVKIDDCKNAEEIAHKVLKLEHHFYPKIIEKALLHQ